MITPHTHYINVCKSHLRDTWEVFECGSMLQRCWMSEVYNHFSSLSLPHSFLSLVLYWIFLFVYLLRLWRLDDKTVNESAMWVTNRLTRVPEASGSHSEVNRKSNEVLFFFSSPFHILFWSITKEPCCNPGRSYNHLLTRLWLVQDFAPNCLKGYSGRFQRQFCLQNLQSPCDDHKHFLGCFCYVYIIRVTVIVSDLFPCNSILFHIVYGSF